MGSTLTNLLFHIVFSTKDRAPWITEEIQPRLWDYVGGIIRSERGMCLAIGGAADHLHILLRWRTDESLSVLMRDLKSHSSRWIHETFPTHGEFRWQDGYAAFSVSVSQIDKVARYIADQAERHAGRDFKEELMTLLRAHGVDFQEKYL